MAMRNPDLVLLMTSSMFTRHEKVACATGTSPIGTADGRHFFFL